MNHPLRLTPGANTPVALDQLMVGFGWRLIESNGPAPELVPAAILCDQGGRAVSADSLVFFNQLSTTTAGGTIQYVTGADEEQIDITLTAVPDQVARIMLVVFVNPHAHKPGTFDSVRDAYVRLAGGDGDELARFAVPAQTETVAAVNFGELYRHQGAWKFRALGDGYRGGVTDVARTFGITL